jgi:hypothetical protein
MNRLARVIGHKGAWLKKGVAGDEGSRGGDARDEQM